MTRCRLILIAMIVFTATSSLLAQQTPRQRQIDSLHAELQRPQHDTTRYAIFTKLGFLYYDGTLPDSALAAAKQAKDVAELLRDDVRISDACFLVGTIYRALLATYDKALEYFFLGLERLENERESFPRYDRALEYSFQEAERSESARKTYQRYWVRKARLLVEISLAFESLEDFEQAISFATQARQISHENGFKFYESVAAACESSVQRLLGDYDAAMLLNERALVLRRELGDSVVVGRSIGTIGEILYLKGKPLDALPHLYKSLEMLKGETHNTIRICNNLARCYLALNQLDSAAHYAQKGYDLCIGTRRKFGLQQCYKVMSSVKEKTGQFEDALLYQKRYNELRDTIMSGQRRQRAAAIQFRSAVIEKEKELEQQRTIRNILVVSLSGLMIAVLVVAVAYRQKQKSEKALQEKTQLIEKQNRLLEAQRDDLAEANKLKSELLAIAAHDLKNPLQSILGFASLVEEQALPNSEFATMSAFIKKSSDKMLRLINDLLDTAVVQVGRMKLQKTTADVSDLAKDVVSDFLSTAERKNQTIEFRADPQALASIDEERLRQVFANFISNAIKYSPVGKKIWVKVEKVDGGQLIVDSQGNPSSLSTLNSQLSTVRVSVKDEGQGLTESDKAKLFQQFQRLSAQPTGNESSTGLGLWIAKEIVTMHGGKIWAESIKGEGSTFFVELPALQVAKPVLA